MANLDIIVYALVAGILLVRLWAVLGRRNDEDRQQPNPFATPAPGPAKDEDAPFQLDRGRAQDVPGQPFGQSMLAPMSLLGSLKQIEQLDPAFDEKEFLRTARTTFTSVVSGFAKGDLTEIEPVLGPSVRSGFEAAMKTRLDAGETLQTRIARITDIETTAARVEDTRAFITVRFASEQENILRDAAGNVMSGAPGRTEEIVDIWTFAHDTKSSDPAWKLIETKS